MRRSPQQQRVSWLGDCSPQKQVEPQGFSGLCHLTKASLSREAWGGRKCHPGPHPAPTKSAIVLGGSRIRAQRDLPQGLNVTTRVGALLSSQPFWGTIVGNERAGDFSRKCGWQKSNPSCWEHIRRVKSSGMSFPWSKELSGLCRWKEGSFAQQDPSPCHVVSGKSWAGEGLPHSHLYGWAAQYLPSASMGTSYLTGRTIKIERITWQRLC